MAIISGGRINIWNAVKKQFETVHPETEVARITDFADGIVQKLALTSAMTAVTALQKDSWFGKLLKMALTASGVKYSVAQNGYVCLGELFGGLIIQWGYTVPIPAGKKSILQKWPISFIQEIQTILLTPHAGALGYICWVQNELSNIRNGVYISSNMESPGNENGRVSWMAVGK